MGFKHSYRDGWVWDDSQTTAVPNYAQGTSYTIFPYNEPIQKGWVCPLCGRANAPWVAQCSCKPQEVKITHTDENKSTAGPHPSATTSYTSET